MLCKQCRKDLKEFRLILVATKILSPLKTNGGQFLTLTMVGLWVLQ